MASILGIFYLVLILPFFFLFTGLFTAYYNRKYSGAFSFNTNIAHAIQASIPASIIWPIGFFVCLFCTEHGKYGLLFKCEHLRVHEIERYNISSLSVGKSLTGEKLYNATGKARCLDCNRVLIMKYQALKYTSF